MTTNTKNSAYTAQQIEAQESELKELLARVMKDPLTPLTDQAAQLEKRLQSVELISKNIRDDTLPSVQNEIREQGEEIRKLKGLSNAITEGLAELLTARFASVQQEMTELLQGQTSAKDLLSEVQQEQTLLGKTAALATDKVMSSIGESREHLGKNLEGAKAEARDGDKLIGEGISAITDDLRKTATQVIDLASALPRCTDDLNSRLANGFATFERQAQIDRTGLTEALDVMHKRFLWLSILCGLSCAGSIGLITSRLL